MKGRPVIREQPDTEPNPLLPAQTLYWQPGCLHWRKAFDRLTETRWLSVPLSRAVWLFQITLDVILCITQCQEKCASVEKNCRCVRILHLPEKPACDEQQVLCGWSVCGLPDVSLMRSLHFLTIQGNARCKWMKVWRSS